jgi:MinD-like ATPase involved in chromosome partitioning or flagellar assembly
MLTIHILERGAKERESLTVWFQSLIHEENTEIEFIPRVDLKPVALEELQFAGTPDLCILGPALLEEDLTCIRKVREIVKKVPLLACTSPRLETLAHVEQFARLGVTDTISVQDSSSAFLRKLILLSRNKQEERKAKLVLLDSGKGGIGVTTTAAALAEMSALCGKKTVLIDFDFETQDLTRFLQARPFINENLQLLLEGSRTLSDEAVEQCLSQVWEDESNLFHIAPPPESEMLYASDSKTIRLFLSFLEFLDERFDCIVVDSGCVRGVLQRTLYRVADEVVFLLNNDPATIYASADRLKKVQEAIPSSGRVTILDNGSKSGLPRPLLVAELERAVAGSEPLWAPLGIPYCRHGAKWPASGGTFVSLSRNPGRHAVEKLALHLEIMTPEYLEEGVFERFVSQLRRKKNPEAEPASPTTSSQQYAPQASTQTKAVTHVRALPEPATVLMSADNSTDSQSSLIALTQASKDINSPVGTPNGVTVNKKESPHRLESLRHRYSSEKEDASSSLGKDRMSIGDLISGVTIR